MHYIKDFHKKWEKAFSLKNTWVNYVAYSPKISIWFTTWVDFYHVDFFDRVILVVINMLEIFLEMCLEYFRNIFISC